MLCVVQNIAAVDDDAADHGIKEIQNCIKAVMNGSYKKRMILVSNLHQVKLLQCMKKMDWQRICNQFDLSEPSFLV